VTAQPTPDQAAYQRAAEVADVLLRDGLPLVRFRAFDQGRRVGFVFDAPPHTVVTVDAPTDRLSAAAVAADYAARLR
jgi:hypothetical protein